MILCIHTVIRLVLEIKIEIENSLHCIDRDGDEFNDILGFSEED